MKITPLRMLVAVIAAAGLVAGCTSSDDNVSDVEPQAEESNLISSFSVEPMRPLIPADTMEEGGGILVDLLFSGLVTYDVDGELQLEMAETIDTPDGRFYTVTLRDDIHFNDGLAVTAQHFVDAWNYTVDNDLARAYQLRQIVGFDDSEPGLSGLKVIDDRTFTIELDSPDPDFQLRLGLPTFFPLHPNAYDDVEAHGYAPLGNGPYMLVEWNHHQNVVLTPNSHYAGSRTPVNEGIEFVFYDDMEQAYDALVAGELDILDELPDRVLGRAEDDLGERVDQHPGVNAHGIAINTNEPNFRGQAGKMRRQAISMAIDREAIGDEVFAGTWEPAVDFTTPGLVGHNPDLNGNEVLTHQPEEARRLWDEAQDMSPMLEPLHISYNADGAHKTWVEQVRDQLQETLGVEMIVEAFPDFKTFRYAIEENSLPGIFRYGWQADYPGGGSFLMGMFESDGLGNDTDYSNPEYDALVAEYTLLTGPERVDLIDQAQEILLEDLPMIPLWNSTATTGYGEDIEHIEFDWRAVPVYWKVTKN